MSFGKPAKSKSLPEGPDSGGWSRESGVWRVVEWQLRDWVRCRSRGQPALRSPCIGKPGEAGSARGLPADAAGPANLPATRWRADDSTELVEVFHVRPRPRDLPIIFRPQMNADEHRWGRRREGGSFDTDGSRMDKGVLRCGPARPLRGGPASQAGRKRSAASEDRGRPRPSFAPSRPRPAPAPVCRQVQIREIAY